MLWLRVDALSYWSKLHCLPSANSWESVMEGGRARERERQRVCNWKKANNRLLIKIELGQKLGRHVRETVINNNGGRGGSQAAREGNKSGTDTGTCSDSALYCLYYWITIAPSNLCSDTKLGSVYFRSWLPGLFEQVVEYRLGSSNEMWQASVRELVSDRWLPLIRPLYRWQRDNITRELILCTPSELGGIEQYSVFIVGRQKVNDTRR